jgi:hypothetical protein
MSSIIIYPDGYVVRWPVVRVAESCRALLSRRMSSAFCMTCGSVDNQARLTHRMGYPMQYLLRACRDGYVIVLRLGQTEQSQSCLEIFCSLAVAFAGQPKEDS